MLFSSNLSPSRGSHVGWLFTNGTEKKKGEKKGGGGGGGGGAGGGGGGGEGEKEKRKKSGLVTRLTLLPHIPALSVISLATKWRYSGSCFHDFQTSIFNNQYEKSGEKLLCVYC